VLTGHVCLPVLLLDVQARASRPPSVRGSMDRDAEEHPRPETRVGE
jgi:hypothetical protein